MKLLLTLCLAFLACSQAKEAGIRRYDGYQVYSIVATTRDQYQILWNVYTSNESNLDFWTKPVINGKTDVMVPPEEQNAFKLLLDKNGMSYTVKVDDVQGLIDEEKLENEQAKMRSGTKALGWDSYARYAEIEEFIKSTPSLNKIAEVEEIGKSYENKALYAVKISSGPGNKKAIFVDANIHAREWITSASATWIMNELLTNTDKYKDMLEGVDYYFVPMINVDGYEFCHTNDRMWRKTRSVNSGSTCRGCDPNRNFPFQFGGEGTSSSPCSDTFKGPSAFSEKETKALSDYIDKLMKTNKVNLKAYISFHSYGQLWLLPWGYTANAYPPDYSEQLSLGNQVRDEIRKLYQTTYEVGTGADVLYGVGGASDDYAKSIGIKYTVTAEMRDTGRYGFVLPPSQIIPNAEEMMVALQTVAKRVQSDPE